MTATPPDVCPGCGEDYRVSVPAGVDVFERDESGAITGEKDEYRVDDPVRTCAVGSGADDYAGWRFVH